MKFDRLKKLAEAIPQQPKQVVVGIWGNPEIATYATYNEFGWVQRVTGRQAGYLNFHYGLDLKPGYTLQSPPRPFMRATAAAKQKKWTKTLKAGIQHYGLTNIYKALAATGRIAQIDIQQTIQNNGVVGGEAFPDRSPMTLEIYAVKDALTASGRKRKIESDSGTGRDKALFLSGTLLQSIGYEIK